MRIGDMYAFPFLPLQSLQPKKANPKSGLLFRMLAAGRARGIQNQVNRCEHMRPQKGDYIPKSTFSPRGGEKMIPESLGREIRL